MAIKKSNRFRSKEFYFFTSKATLLELANSLPDGDVTILCRTAPTANDGYFVHRCFSDSASLGTGYHFLGTAYRTSPLKK